MLQCLSAAVPQCLSAAVTQCCIAIVLLLNNAIELLFFYEVSCLHTELILEVLLDLKKLDLAFNNVKSKAPKNLQALCT